jgi:hypothetical protein
MEMWGQRFGAVVMDLSVHEQPRKTVRCARISSWGRPSGLPPSFRSARSVTSAGNAGDLVAGVLKQPVTVIDVR